MAAASIFLRFLGLCSLLVVLSEAQSFSLPSNTRSLVLDADIEGGFLLLRFDDSLPHGAIEVDVLNEFDRDVDVSFSSSGGGEARFTWAVTAPSSSIAPASVESAGSPIESSAATKLSGQSLLLLPIAIAVAFLAGGRNSSTTLLLIASICALLCCYAGPVWAQNVPLGEVHIVVRLNSSFAASLDEIDLDADTAMIGLEVDRHSDNVNVRCRPGVPGTNDACFTPFCHFGDNDCLQDSVVKIGMILSTTGDSASFGQELLFAGEEAIAELPLPVPVQFWFADSATNPEQAVSLAQQMYAEGVRLFVGPVTSAEAEALGEWIAGRGDDDDFEEVAFLSPDVSFSAIAESESLFTLTMDNLGGAHALLSASVAALSDLTTRRAVVIHRDDRFATDFLSILTSISDFYDIEITSTVSYVPGSISSTADAANVASQLDAAVNQNQADFVIVLGFDKVQWIVDASQGMLHYPSVPWTGAGFCLSDAMLRPDLQAFTASIPLSCVAFHGSHTGDNIRRIELLASVSTAFDTVSSSLAPAGYDSVLLILATTRLTQTDNTESIRSALVEESFQTFALTGWLRLDTDTGTRIDGDFSVFLSVDSTEIAPHDPVALVQLVSLKSTTEGTSAFRSRIQNIASHPIPPTSPVLVPWVESSL